MQSFATDQPALAKGGHHSKRGGVVLSWLIGWPGLVLSHCWGPCCCYSGTNSMANKKVGEPDVLCAGVSCMCVKCVVHQQGPVCVCQELAGGLCLRHFVKGQRRVQSETCLCVWEWLRWLGQLGRGPMRGGGAWWKQGTVRDKRSTWMLLCPVTLQPYVCMH